MMNKNKKAVFFTLTAVLILIVILFLFIWEGEHKREIDEANVQYTKHKVTSDYIKDVENLYLPSVISVSEKFAIRNISYYVYNNPAAADSTDRVVNLTYIVMTGHIDNQTGNSATKVMELEKTLPYLLNTTFNTLSSPIKFEYFDFQVLSVEHITNDTIQVNSTVNFTIKSQTLTWREFSNITWSNQMNYSTDLSIIGFYNPVMGKAITDNWIANETYDCFLRKVDSSYCCGCSGGFKGLCPFGECSYPHE